jgi:hypothetical protein
VNAFTIFCCSRVGETFVGLRKRGGGIGDWRTLYSEEIHDFCFSPHTIYFYGSQSPSGPRSPHYQGFTITLKTHHTRLDLSRRVIGPMHRPLPDNTQHSTTDKDPCPGGIRTSNPSKRAAEDPRVKTRGHLDRPPGVISVNKSRWMTTFLRNLQQVDHLEGLSVIGRMILKWNLKKYAGRI